MLLIVGLGNHEREYHQHRHNAGFMFADYLFNELAHSISSGQASLRINEFKYDKYSNSSLVKFVINNDELIIAKPQTFMNNSGQAVSKLNSEFKIQNSELIVVHDDLDIPLGKFKIDRGAGPKLHNGIRSIEEFLKTADFWRVRIGIDNRNPDHHISGEAYVLENFKPEERKIIDSEFPQIWSRIKTELLNSA
jgi:peptidyl-tRNA hydrolase, PTH1 family